MVRLPGDGEAWLHASHEGLPSVSARPRILTLDPIKEIKIASVSVGGERFIAQQVKPGSWSVLDRRYRELVGSDDKSHDCAEQRAAALNAAMRACRLRGISSKEENETS